METKEEQADYIARLQELALMDDYETSHGDADELLCDILNKLGYSSIVEKYHEVGKWYA